MLKPRLAEAAPGILALLLDGIQFNVCKYSRQPQKAPEHLTAQPVAYQPERPPALAERLELVAGRLL